MKQQTIETDDAKFRRVIEKAWTNPEFKARLISNPASTLRDEGIEPPSGLAVEVVESTAKKRYFVLPPAPDSKLSVQEFKTKSDNSDYRALVHLLYNVNCC